MSDELEKSLKLSPYEYVQYCNEIKYIRGVAVITDKQWIFYSQILENDYGTHNDIVMDIETEVYHNPQYFGRSSNAYIFLVGGEIIISMPDNGELSLSQTKFISDILEKINKYANEEENFRKQINIGFFAKKNSCFNITDINKIQQKLKEMTTTNITIEEEKIIGNTLTKEEIKNNLLTYLDFKNCSNMKEVIDILIRCKTYYKDSYYKETFLEIFPDYVKINDIINKYNNKNMEQERVNNVTFKNVKEIIYSSIRNSFKDKNSYDEIWHFLFSYQSGFTNLEEEIKEKIFPNFKLVSETFKSIYPSNEEEKKSIDILLKNVSNYKEFSIAICTLGYQKKNQELIKTENLLAMQNEFLEEIQFENNIISSKKDLNEMIDRKNELEKLILQYNTEISENQILIESEKLNQDRQNRQIKDSSSNFLKKIINSRKLKNYKDKLNQSKLKSITIESKNEELQKKISELNKEIKLIKQKFKKMTNLDDFALDKSFMEIYYKKDNSNYESYIIESINKLNKKIAILKQELIALNQSGLVIINNKKTTNKEETEIYKSSKHHH